MTTHQNADDVRTHFDLHAELGGYLSRVRWVKPQRGARFLSCSINAFRKEGDKISRTYCDMKVVGKDAIAIVSRLEKAVLEKGIVFIRVRVGDLRVESYMGGKDRSEERLQVKCRLLKVLECEKLERYDDAGMAKKYGADIKVHGLGYINRIAKVNGSSLSSISALVGAIELQEDDKRQYTAFDLLNSDSVLPAISALEEAVNADSSVLVGFDVINIFPGSFKYSRGDHAGETGYVLKGELTRISFAKVDGVKVDFESEPDYKNAA